MRTGSVRRWLLLLALSVLIAVACGLFNARWQQSLDPPAEQPHVACPDTATAWLVLSPTRVAHDADKLALDLPAPILIEPTPCRAGR